GAAPARRRRAGCGPGRSRAGVHEWTGERARGRGALRQLRLPRDRRGLPHRGRSRGLTPPQRGLGGLRVVAIPARSWRPFAAPAAFLAAVTLAVVGARALWPHHAAHATQPAGHHAKAPAGPRYYRVRAGDTLAAI